MSTSNTEEDVEVEEYIALVDSRLNRFRKIYPCSKIDVAIFISLKV